MDRRPPLSPFRIDHPAAAPWAAAPLGLLGRALGLDELDALYRGLPGRGDAPFADLALQSLEVRAQWLGDLAAVPRAGALLVVANHPFGGIEGVLLLSLLKSLRPDVKVVANRLLARIPELADDLVAVDVFHPRSAANVAGLRRALAHLKAGGCLACFPSGEVSSLDVARGGVVDPAWDPKIVRLAQIAGAPALPVWFDGANSPLFHAVGLVHPRLRTALLAKELLGMRRRCVRAVVGGLVPAAELAALPSREAARLLQGRAALLAGRLPDPRPPRRRAAPSIPELEPIAQAQHPRALESEIARLPPSSLLAEGSGLKAYIARAGEIPLTLREIGVQRERCFRAAGEGTGKASDLDGFDAWYLHLFLWNPEARELAGAYRIGPTDEILEARGRAGLYTHSLFHLSRALLRQLDPGLEMGRSFVRGRYQGAHGPLLLLWKAIGRFLLRHPRYRRLFGPVSISADYRPMSRALMAKWCRRHLGLEGARPLAAIPRRPHRAGLHPGVRHLPEALEDFEALERAVAVVEGGRGAPVLLKHYARLGGRFAGFNVDPQFGGALDGLVVVDLARTDTRLLGMYMGRQEAADWQRRHLG